MAPQRVFLDTNVIIECFKIGVWTELSKGHKLETVDEVITEAMTGDTSRRGHVLMDRTELLGGLAMPPYPVTRQDRNKLLRDYPTVAVLDPGELNLFAYLNAHELPLGNFKVVSTADKGAIAFCKLPGWLDHLVSLEELLVSANTSRGKLAQLGPQHYTKFLAEVRTQVWLGFIP
ncbi:hypothetical protein [Rugamonas sp.]|uniref:hypothetical protein n=1 Tax=Rugamonas sp. TaxID=1926287 RepID=UPI0025DEAE6E|nr:hypothetical protein [Rugamonas sp.]